MGICNAEELTQGVSPSIYLHIEEIVKLPVGFHISLFKQALIKKAAEDGTWKPVARYVGPSGWQTRKKEPTPFFQLIGPI